MKCELCDYNLALTLDDGDNVFILCPNHLLKLVTHSLCTEEAKKLIKIHGNKTFYLHDDFYCKNYHPIQPMI